MAKHPNSCTARALRYGRPQSLIPFPQAPNAGAYWVQVQCCVVGHMPIVGQMLIGHTKICSVKLLLQDHMLSHVSGPFA